MQCNHTSCCRNITSLVVGPGLFHVQLFVGEGGMMLDLDAHALSPLRGQNRLAALRGSQCHALQQMLGQ